MAVVKGTAKSSISGCFWRAGIGNEEGWEEAAFFFFILRLRENYMVFNAHIYVTAIKIRKNGAHAHQCKMCPAL